MQQLDHETGETLEGTWYADSRIDFNEDAFGALDIDLEFASLVYG